MKARQSNKLPLCIYSTVESSSRASSPVIPSEPRLSNKQLEEKKLVTHGYTITKFTFLRFFVLFFFRSVFHFCFGQKHSLFSCCGCKKSYPKSEINSICILSLYNTVILRFSFVFFFALLLAAHTIYVFFAIMNFQ